MTTFDISARRACRLLNINKSTYYYKSHVSDFNIALSARIKEIDSVLVRYSYPRIHVLLRREGFAVIRRRVYRLNSLQGLNHVVRAGGKCFALVEGGALPVEFSYQLDSTVNSDFGGGLTKGFSAHPKADPATGVLHAIAYQPGQPNIQYFTIDTNGTAHAVAEISLPHMPEVHDIGLTERSVVILDLPVTFQPWRSEVSSFPYLWNADQPPRVGLMPRSGDTSKIQWFDAPSCFVFHILNSYDRGDDVIIDVCRHSKMFATDTRGVNEGRPVLARWTLNRNTSQLVETIIEDRGAEFPRINDFYQGLAYRFGYTASWRENVQFGPTMKHDLITGTTELHDYGTGRVALEPVFVPRPGAVAEDDGWVMSFVYDAERNLSDVVLLDAQNLAGAPVATVQLPVRVPFGFHGAWFADA